MNIKNKSVLLLVFVLMSFCVNAQNLIPYHKGEKWGFCTADNEMVVKPGYERVELFKNGYALVVKNNKLGMINEKGEEVIPCLYKDLHRSSEGLLMAKNEELLCGYLDVSNKTVIAFQYEYASDFLSGAACVKLKGGDCFLIDKNGKKLPGAAGWVKMSDKNFIPAKIDVKACFAVAEVIPVVKGASYYRTKDLKGNMRVFLADKNGKPIGKNGYISMNMDRYKESAFIEVSDYNGGSVYNLIDKTGKELLPMQRSKFSDFYYGLAYNESCIIDTTGKVLMDSVVIHYASERFVRVKYNDSTMRYYDLKRRAFFPAGFVWGSSVSNGLAFAKTDDNQEVCVNLLTGKKKELTELQKTLEKFRGDDALTKDWSKEQLEIHSKVRFRFQNDANCFDKYLIVDNDGKPTGAIVHSFSQFLNSVTDKNGSKKEELAFTHISPEFFDYVISDSDTLIILNSTPLLRNEKLVIKTDPINKSILYSDQCVMVDLNGNVRYEVNMDGAKAYDKKGNLINTFHCYTCDGEVKGIINHRITYDRELKMFLSPMGYISLDFKTAYFEE